MPRSVNTNGLPTGTYYDGSGNHVFLRNLSGIFITFDVPGTLGTYPISINDAGAVTGYYSSPDYPYPSHGFLRISTGVFIEFDPPASADTFPTGINSDTVVGVYLDATNVYHGLLRLPGGDVITLDVPGADTGASQGTVAESINAAGAVTGYYFDATGNNQGFLRSPGGTFVTFDIPGCLETLSVSINDT